MLNTLDKKFSIIDCPLEFFSNKVNNKSKFFASCANPEEK